jgi:hypothetical protein
MALTDWISQGVPSLFQAIYDNLLDKVMSMAGITNVDNDFGKDSSIQVWLALIREQTDLLPANASEL